MPPQIHWAREVPNEMKDVVEIYLNDPRAEQYRVIDRAKNGGHDPEKTTISDNICFCLVKPTYDQCADPTYTQLRANLPVWDKERSVWHKESVCDNSCACSSSTTWFRSISRSEALLNEGLLCKPVLCSELLVEDDGGVTPKLHKLSCTRGECAHVDCLEAKLEQLRGCKTEFEDSTKKVRYRKYAKMNRTRNDGTEYSEVEFVYVLETRKDFTGTPTAHKVLPCTQEKADRELATEVAEPLELTRVTDCRGGGGTLRSHCQLSVRR